MANELDVKLKERWELRKTGKFKEADLIREELIKMHLGLVIEDYAWGTIAHMPGDIGGIGGTTVGG